MGRLAHIGVVLLGCAGLGLPAAAYQRSWRPLAQALCRGLEHLGPAFIKLGQFFSVRPDLVPPSALVELERLQDRATPLPFTAVAAVLEAELLAPPTELFRSLDRTPLATASLSQVHRAVLPDGTEVAVKVQRPGAESSLDGDLRLLGGVLERLLPLTPLRRRLDSSSLLTEVRESAEAELNFLREAEVAEAFRRNLRNLPRIRVPRVYWAWTSRRVLTTELITGTKISSPENRQRPDYAELAELGATAFLQQVLEDGLFHADLHPANLLITPAGEIAYLDFGIVGALTAEERHAILGTLAGMLARDPHLALRNLDRLGVRVPPGETAGFVGAIGQVMDAAVGPVLQEVSMTRLGRGILAAVHRHRVDFPRRHVLLVKALLTIEGSARNLHPNFSFETASRKYLLARIRKEVTWSRFLEAGWRAGALVGLAAVCAVTPHSPSPTQQARSPHA